MDESDTDVRERILLVRHVIIDREEGELWLS